MAFGICSSSQPVSFQRHTQGEPHEAHVSAEPFKAPSSAWIQAPYEPPGGTADFKEKTRQGTPAAGRISHFELRLFNGSWCVVGGERFPRRERMRMQWEFDQVREHGNAFTGRYLVFSALCVRQARNRRVGIIVSKRIGDGVTRNRIKRRLREIYRRHRNTVLNDIRLVLIARRAIVQASFDEVKDEFLQLNQKFTRTVLCQS